eukprot:1159603-Pelagomonas_calceolata.AAC.2
MSWQVVDLQATRRCLAGQICMNIRNYVFALKLIRKYLLGLVSMQPEGGLKEEHAGTLASWNGKGFSAEGEGTGVLPKKLA